MTEVAPTHAAATTPKREAVQDQDPLQNVNTQTPDSKASPTTPSNESPTDSQGSNSSGIIGGVKPNNRKYRRQLGEDGKPKKNFYNPPGKVMRQLAQQQYHQNMYGNNGQYYALRQKYKTQMCKHFLKDGCCPLKQYCQFAHGPEELRQSNDPLPEHFGKHALGAIHSNYKTMPCKNFLETGECKFGEGCSFYHNDKERRKLIDPLPSLPEGASLPPMPEKLKNYKKNKAAQEGQEFQSPQPAPFFQLSSLTDIMALGGFNPNKYMTPQPLPFGATYYGFGYPGYGQVPPHLIHQQMHAQQHYGNPQPFNGQTPISQKGEKPQKQNSDKKTDKKKEKNREIRENGKPGEKKYVTKLQTPLSQKSDSK